MMSLWGVFCSCLLIFAAGPIFGFFIPEEAVRPLGVDYLVILGFSELFMCWEILVEGAYAGLGHTAPPSILSMVLTMARIPLAMVLTSTALGLNGIWWSISISSICKGVILGSCLPCSGAGCSGGWKTARRQNKSKINQKGSGRMNSNAAGAFLVRSIPENRSVQEQNQAA